MQHYRLFIVVSITSLITGMLCVWFSPPSLARAEGDTITIHITGTAQPPGFSPTAVTAHVNDMIVFLNDAIPAAPYAVAADDQSFASPPIPSGQQWSTTFTEPGDHEYHDPTFPAQMVGQLIIVPADVTLLPTPAPGALATALAQVKAQQQGINHNSSTTTGQAYWRLLLIVLAGVVLLIGGVALFWLIRSRQRRQARTRV